MTCFSFLKMHLRKSTWLQSITIKDHKYEVNKPKYLSFLAFREECEKFFDHINFGHEDAVFFTFATSAKSIREDTGKYNSYVDRYGCVPTLELYQMRYYNTRRDVEFSYFFSRNLWEFCRFNAIAEDAYFVLLNVQYS